MNGICAIYVKKTASHHSKPVVAVVTVVREGARLERKVPHDVSNHKNSCVSWPGTITVVERLL